MAELECRSLASTARLSASRWRVWTGVARVGSRQLQRRQGRRWGGRRDRDVRYSTIGIPYCAVGTGRAAKQWWWRGCHPNQSEMRRDKIPRASSGNLGPRGETKGRSEIWSVFASFSLLEESLSKVSKALGCCERSRLLLDAGLGSEAGIRLLFQVSQQACRFRSAGPPPEIRAMPSQDGAAKSLDLGSLSIEDPDQQKADRPMEGTKPKLCRGGVDPGARSRNVRPNISDPTTRPRQQQALAMHGKMRGIESCLLA
ncbi:hypothetical protein B0T26DRAFT_224881 [Lasiosphaeria miniovina]|uniref:Uncharacterized protein n=1 Tax=Lasiosphaeria miniovina TaxID=1954250 RepID=A0AA40AV50_9PEZI|nr:uncharacterized protein B0T26DRAFT_224881 [Lasiosphaeria miniovina]KAK0722544.1 hypothetical protein B0T26DRAFT_224881 [Lasiosphaeria miniovina]